MMKILRYLIMLTTLLFIISCNGSNNSADVNNNTDTVKANFSPQFTAFQTTSVTQKATAKNNQGVVLLSGKLTVKNLDKDTTEDIDWKASLNLDTFVVTSETTLGLSPGEYRFILDLEHNGQKYHGDITTDIADGNELVDMTINPILGNIDTQVTVNPEMAKLYFNVSPEQLNLLGLNDPIVGIIIDNNAEMKFMINPSTSRSDLFFNIAFGQYRLAINFYDDNQQVGKLAVPDSPLNIDGSTPTVDYDVVPLMAVTVFAFNTQGNSTDLMIKVPDSVISHVADPNDLETELKLVNSDNMIIVDTSLDFMPITGSSEYQATLPLNLSFADANSDTLYLTLKFFDKNTNSTNNITSNIAFATCTSDTFALGNQDKSLGCQVSFTDTEIDVITALNALFVVNVHDTNGNPIKGADVFLDGATTPVGTTGDDPFTSDGALIIRTSVGSHEIVAKAIGFVSQKTVNATPLGVNNIDLYLTEREDTTDHKEAANYDTRTITTAGINVEPTTEQINQVLAIQTRLPTVDVKYDKTTGIARVIYNKTGYLTEADPSKSIEETVMEFLDSQRGLLRLSATDLANVNKQVRQTNATGAHRYYFQQQRYGRDIFNALLQVNVNRDGRILSVNNNFSPSVDQVIQAKEPPAVSAADAIIQGALAVGIKVSHAPMTESEDLAADDQKTQVQASSASKEPIEAKLVYFPIKGDLVRLAWTFLLFTHDQRHVYQMLVDAQNGEVLAFFDQVDSDSYEVFEYPVESPNHAIVPNTRAVVNNPAAGPGSPWMWHDTNASIGAELTTMHGNNVHAYNDSNNSGSPTGVEPDCGAGIACIFPLDLTLQPEDSSYAATTNLFYWNNLIHDVTYLYGFDQASGNFQKNQYGGAGLGGDEVKAEAQDGGGTNNANFWTPADGVSPRMQMYLWTLTTPKRDGDYDSGIIAHEYAHGISNRLVGGASNVNCLNNYQRPSEGISDLYGLMFTHTVGMTGATPRGIGTYVLGQPITGPGIRPQQYSTDPTVNTYTYETIMSGMSVPHGIGSVWAQAAWEVYWALVDEHGFDANLHNAMGGSGNQRAFLYFTEGLKNTICSPSFIDARDGIIQAAIDNYSGADVCLVWQAFADFGLGSDATSVSNNSLTVTNGFAVPDACDLTADVWVEDTHFDYTGILPDTGNEPDANMVSKSMWRSKAIWNRITTGSPGSHQNPEFGQKNEIYVNVKNRGAATAFNTTVEVYWAHAATGLSWPADWNLLGTDTIGSLPVGADIQATVAWVPPSTGHYCLIARLVNPQDPMTNPEGSNISYNTRYNNNIAWRNMNIVDLLANFSQNLSFIARGIEKSNNQILLQVGTSEQQQFLIDGGKLKVNLKEFTGNDVWEEITVLPHFIRDLQSPTGRNDAQVHLMFSAEPMPISDKERGLYQLDILQLEPGNNEEVGGVAYEIITRSYLTDTDGDDKPDIQDDDDDNDQILDIHDPYPLDELR